MASIFRLMIRKLKGEEVSQHQFDAAMDKEPDATLERDFNRLWSLSSNYKQSDPFDVDIEFNLQRFKSKIAETETPVLPIRSNPLAKWMVAAVAIGMALGIWWFMRPNQKLEWQTIASSATDIRQVTLPDGSIVRLNRNSTLSLPLHFNQLKKRLIRLDGEAFFAVTHRPDQPFEIETALSKVRVLGTRFNLRALSSENFTEVEVEDGLVALMDKATGNSIQLPKNSKGQHQKDGGLSKIETKTMLSQIWSSGKIFCDATPLSQVKTILERHSNLHIRFLDPKYGEVRITGNLYLNRAENSFSAVVLTAGLRLEKDQAGVLLVK